MRKLIEIRKRLNKHLEATMFGGLFREGWPGPAPRIVFYSYVAFSAIEWMIITVLVAMITPFPFAVCMFSAIVYALNTFDLLVVERGEHASEGWKLPLMFVSCMVGILHVMPIATIVFETYEWQKHDGVRKLISEVKRHWRKPVAQEA